VSGEEAGTRSARSGLHLRTLLEDHSGIPLDSIDHLSLDASNSHPSESIRNSLDQATDLWMSGFEAEKRDAQLL
jgi:hypothetical protein